MTMRLRHILLSLLAMLAVVPATAGMINRTDPAAVKGASLQPYKYNGKELDLMHGLNTYDYGARQYDPILVRWDRVDPLCEKKPWQSPYIYGKNNPLRYIDPDGKDDMDKAVGYLVGVATNIMPIPGARDLYSPTDADDYNAALQTTDNTFMAMGNSMVDAGRGGIAIGTAVAATGGAIVTGSGGAAAVAGTSTAVAGVTLVGVGAATGLAGTLVKMNATSNKNGGYERGNKISVSQANNMVSKGKAPKGIKHVHHSHGHKGQDHVHTEKGSINADGSGHDGPKPILTKAQEGFIKRIKGFKISEK